jgi:DNA-binding NarL/FixJ family response regulator
VGAALTGQENRILELIADGLTNREIAESVSRPEAAVKTSVSSLFGKLGVSHRTQVAAYAGRLAGSRGEAPPGDT